jgi:hypothetical protein
MGIPRFFLRTGYSGWSGSCLGRIAQVLQLVAHHDGTSTLFLQNADLFKRINLIWPVQSQLQKQTPSLFSQIKSITRAVSSHVGALAIVTNAGRDAMDADVLLTNGTEADGEVVWF